MGMRMTLRMLANSDSRPTPNGAALEHRATVFTRVRIEACQEIEKKSSTSFLAMRDETMTSKGSVHESKPAQTLLRRESSSSACACS